MWCRLRTMLHVYCLLQSSYAVCMPKVPHCEMERYQITSYIYFFLHKFFGVILGLRMLVVHECCEEIQTYLGSFTKKSPLFFSKWLSPRTTDARWGNRFHCRAENPLPLPNFYLRPKHILSAISAQNFRFLWFMPSMGVGSPWLSRYKTNHQKSKVKLTKIPWKLVCNQERVMMARVR